MRCGGVSELSDFAMFYYPQRDNENRCVVLLGFVTRSQNASFRLDLAFDSNILPWDTMILFISKARISSIEAFNATGSVIIVFISLEGPNLSNAPFNRKNTFDQNET